MNWTSMLSKLATRNAGILKVLAMILALGATGAAAGDDQYRSRSTHVVATVGLPPAIALDSSQLENGDYEIALDILTGNRLFAQIIDGRREQTYLVSPHLGRIELKTASARDGQCTAGICGTFHIETCATTPWGDCHCFCSGFKADEP